MTRLPDTSMTSIAMGFFAANMERKLRLLFAPEYGWALDYDFDLGELVTFPSFPDVPAIQWMVRPLEPLPPDERTSYPVQRRASVLHPQEYLLHRQGVAPVPVCPIPDSNLVRPHRQESVRIPLADKGRQQ